MWCLHHSKFPLLKRLSDGGWISCMFVNIICSPLHPWGTGWSLKVSHSNANICLAQQPEPDTLGHLHQRYSPVDTSHKVESQRWDNGRADRGLSMQMSQCSHHCAQQSILFNISRLNGEQVESFGLSKEDWFPSFAWSGRLSVMSFSGRPSFKNGDKTFRHNGPKKSSFSSLCGAELMIVWAKRGQIKALKVQKRWDPQTIWHGRSHSSPFTKLLLCVFYPPPSPGPPPPTLVIGRVDESSTSQYHTTFYLTAFIILSFWIISSSDGLAKNDWRILESRAATAWLSGVSWQALSYTVPDAGGPAKCLAKGLH